MTSIDSLAPRRRRQRGQIVPLTVLMLIVLIGMTGLAIDVGSALYTQRFERAIADAASLAGGQDLQRTGTNTAPGATERGRARGHAMDVLAAQLGGTKPVIDYTNDTLPCFTTVGCNLPGTPYTVAIRTPAPSCVVGSDCVDHPELAVQVTITNPSFGLSFTRVLGVSRWAVSASSVAAIVRARGYGVIMLRPPKPARTNGTDPNEDDIFITGGSILTVSGDVGSNTNMVFSGTNSAINLTSVDCAPTCDFRAFHYDAYQAWPSPPIGVQTQTLIKDPGYTFPGGESSLVPFTSESQARDTTTCTGAGGAQSKVPPAYKIAATGLSISDPLSQVRCFKPGVYSFQLVTSSDKTIAYILEPGVYWFEMGLDVGSSIVGGYEAGLPGVALVFNESSGGCPPGSPGNKCALTGQNADLIALNFGSAYQDASGTRATAAMDNSSPTPKPVQTSGATAVLMSLMVKPDAACYVPTPPLYLEPSGCDESKNKTLILPGGGNFWVAGVQYAPSDNVNVKGNTTTSGTFGELIAWTVKYDASFLNLEAAVTEKAGVLRLDRACSPGGGVCLP
jgi:Flp pilus assembly protein TadG